MTSLYAPTTDDVKQRLRPFGIFFEKSLKDLIKGIRANNTSTEKLYKFLTAALAECREEVKSPDFNLKTNAVLKLTYLEMYGFDMSWATFHVLEVMSSNKFQQKRVGYLAASQSFHKDSDILMLATNLLKKDLKYDGLNDTMKMGVALSGLSTIVTPSLASDICEDLFGMLNSSKPYIRKKAVTALFKVFLQYPEALRDNFDKFVQKLQDEDMSVVSATVSVICELSKKNPMPFVQLSPLLYEMLINVDNNWITIRLLKLFTNLSQVEPKLKGKILPKVLELMEKTVATSVIYESVNCIVKAHMLENDDYETATCCLQELHKFCNSNDPNLRYISVVLFYKIGKINTDFIADFDALVFRLLKDVDISIRSKALELLEGVVDDDNIVQVVQILVKQFVDQDTIKIVQQVRSQYENDNDKQIVIEIPQSYKAKMVHTILKICSMDNYSNITDFEWFIAVLTDLCVMSQDLNEKSLGYKLGEQLRNVMIKVPSMRDRAIATVIQLISNDEVVQHLPGVLKECFWCLGEFSELIDNGDDLIKLIIKGNKYTLDVQQILIPALLKVFSNWCNKHPDLSMTSVSEIITQLITFLDGLSSSKSFEVQERSVEALELLRLCSDSLDIDDSELPMLITEILPSLFNAWELKPISHGTQRMLQNNLSLDLDTPYLTEEEIQQLLDQDKYQEKIHSVPDSEDEYDPKFESNDPDLHSSDSDYDNKLRTSKLELTEEEYKKLEESKKQERLENPFYLHDDDNEEENKNERSLIDFDDADTAKDEPETESVIRLTRSGKDKDVKKKKKKKRVKVLSDEIIPGVVYDNGTDIKDNQSINSSKSSRNRINLNLQTKLETFDFNKPKDESSIAARVGTYDVGSDDLEGQAELDKLRAKFAEQSIGLGEEEEEVIVIKKKKKKSKDKKKSKKKKKIEGDETHGAE